jgi:hypothetical protein
MEREQCTKPGEIIFIGDLLVFTLNILLLPGLLLSHLRRDWRRTEDEANRNPVDRFQIR